MKNTNWAEKIGLALIIIGFLCMIMNRIVFDELILQITGKYQIFYWSGLCIWALGYMKSEVDRKKQKNDNDSNME